MMSNSKLINQVLLEHLDLEVNCGTYKSECPSCGKHSSFSVTRSTNGLLYNCFRASCGFAGFIPLTDEGVISYTLPDKPRSAFTPPPINEPDFFKDYLVDLDAIDYEFFSSKYGLTYHTLYDFYYTRKVRTVRRYRIAFNILDKNQLLIGRSYRYYKELQPFEHSGYVGPKSIQYRYRDNCPLVSYSRYVTENISQFILVEDYVSMMKIEQCGVPLNTVVISLLGTNIPQPLIKDLINKDVVLWLDADAVQNASNFKHEYGFLFKSCNIIYGEKDPKDCSMELIKHNLGVYGT